tara:strand:+ start:5775 stop:6026 length:252 start_codon:yes stop_codon:yes gene_type:complete
MASFDLIELSIDPLDMEPTIEDEFTATVIKNQIDDLDDIEHVKIASKQLVSIVMQRQAMIRALCKRLTDIEKEDNMHIQRFKG